MRLLNLFGRQRSANTAQQRLQVLLMHERSAPGNADLIPMLREDILAAIGKHIPVDSDRVQVRVERGDSVSLLEIDIEISTLARSISAPARGDLARQRRPRLPHISDELPLRSTRGFRTGMPAPRTFRHPEYFEHKA